MTVDEKDHLLDLYPISGVERVHAKILFPFLGGFIGVPYDQEYQYCRLHSLGHCGIGHHPRIQESWYQ